MYFYTYVIKSDKDDNLYVGWTVDLSRRILDHNTGKVRATKNRAPFKLVYYEACTDRKKAIEREKQLKTGFGRAYLKRRL
ncbi:excinuclease ABC subunit C [Candidatus Roizmanbacteria bacterium RIFCSPLOWO2_01_FULL_40_42]|uniref:Excinuclease ABC subunit C n=1 Tax=Candidatus Roizmanbacteria bacterium RIFCSPLOWO2_01_FULL_40_42 TaxID=1802066 RepID=A0A1F7J621_9BACT|nr:MAG: excinuclease ABC subunit C [Candidatus Roizmanbacteria bacterium RIFCSPLOWO2_01_FULL_40_42]OGK59112.1 MAG: excinuclease ABC subunit C [Candidatus Roizmanbacteria bacterium RIFCSPLOWO2_02_FULL_40_13]